MFKNLKKSYTILETIISVGIVSLIMLSILKLYNDFLKEDGQLNRQEKFEKVAYSLENAMKSNYLNFILTKDIVKLDEDYLPDSSLSITNSQVKKIINDFEVMYSPNIFYPLYSTDNTSPYYYEETEKLFNMKKSEMDLFANEPFDFIFTSNRSNYLGMQFPFKDIFLFNWNEIRVMKGFNPEVKTCFLDGSNGFSIAKFDRLSSITSANGTDTCLNTITDFITNNNNIFPQIQSSNIESSYVWMSNKIKMLQISNYNFVFEKVKETYNNFSAIVNNLKDFAKREIEFSTNEKETMIDHFVFCYFTSSSYCAVHRGNITATQTNVNKIKFLIGTEQWKGGLNNSQRTNTSTVTSAIFSIERNNSYANGDYPMSSIRGTTDANHRTLENLKNGAVKTYGMMSVAYPNTFGVDPTTNSNYVFNKDAYKIFGTEPDLLIGNHTKTNAYESFLGTPFFFSNVSLSGFTVDNVLDDTVTPEVPITFDKHFATNVPIIQTNGRYSTGPYAAILVAYFPWVISATVSELEDGYGYYVYQIESSK